MRLLFLFLSYLFLKYALYLLTCFMWHLYLYCFSDLVSNEDSVSCVWLSEFHGTIFLFLTLFCVILFYSLDTRQSTVLLLIMCFAAVADFKPNSWPGVAVFLQNALIFFAYDILPFMLLPVLTFAACFTSFFLVFLLWAFCHSFAVL